MGIFSDAPGQLQAQAVGAATIFLLAFLATVVVAVPLALIGRAWRRQRAKVVDEAIEKDEPDETSRMNRSDNTLAEEQNTDSEKHG